MTRRRKPPVPPSGHAASDSLRAINEATAKYYQSRSQADIEEDEAFARASSEAARQIDYDAVEIPHDKSSALGERR